MARRRGAARCGAVPREGAAQRRLPPADPAYGSQNALSSTQVSLSPVVSSHAAP